MVAHGGGEKHEGVGVNSSRQVIEDLRVLSQRLRSCNRNIMQPVEHWRQKTLSLSTDSLLYWALCVLEVSVGGHVYSPVYACARPNVICVCVCVWQEMVLILQFDDSTSDVRQCSISHTSIMHTFHEGWMYTVIHSSSLVPWTRLHVQHWCRVHCTVPDNWVPALSQI